MAATIRPGARFGRLVVVIPRGRVTEKNGFKRSSYSPLCLCDCGALTSPRYDHLRSGRTTSCGCGHEGVNTTHGKTGTPEYTIWLAARRRCHNPRIKDYARYGGRGITFSPVFDDFEVFLAEVGPRPSPAYSLDRIKNDRGYEPGNIRWATKAEQSRNTRRNVWVVINGERMTITDACRILGVNATTVRGRRERGWPPERWFEPAQVTVSLCE